MLHYLITTVVDIKVTNGMARIIDEGNFAENVLKS